MCHKDNECKSKIQYSHKRHYNLRNLRDSFQPADDHQTNAHGQDQPCNDGCYGITAAEYRYGVCFLRVKKVAHSRGYTVYLGKGTNPQKAHAGSEEREDFGQPPPFDSHAVFYIIKWSAQHMAVPVNGAVFDGKHTLRVFGCHSEKGCQYHPEKCPRPACRKSCCHSYNISCADSG